jgi:hypothetical protein
MPRRNVKQSDNLPLLGPRHRHARFQAIQQCSGIGQALNEHRMERTLLGPGPQFSDILPHRLVEQTNGDGIGRQLLEPARMIDNSSRRRRRPKD